MEALLNLTPAQLTAANGLSDEIHKGGALVLRGRSQSGKTTILRQLHAFHGGASIATRQWIGAAASAQPTFLEEAFLSQIEEALFMQGPVFIDDLHLVAGPIAKIDRSRAHLFDAALTTILGEAAVQRKTVVFAVEGPAPWPLERRATIWEIGQRRPQRAITSCGLPTLYRKERES